MTDLTTGVERQAVLEAVYRALDTINGLRGAHEQLPRSPQLPLFGAGSALDSLTFTTLVLAVERNVEDLTGVALDLLGSESGPQGLRTIDSTVELVLQQLG